MTGLELFDRNGQNVALVFGERKPGKPELASWRTVVAEIVETNR